MYPACYLVWPGEATARLKAIYASVELTTALLQLRFRIMAESCRPLPVAGFENEFVNSADPPLSCEDAGKPCPMGNAGGVQQPVRCSPSQTDHVPKKMEAKLSNERERHERELSAVKEELKREREAHTIEINKLKEFQY